MADCWLETNTNKLGFETSVYRGKQFPHWPVEQFLLVTQEQKTGAFRVACQRGVDTFLALTNKQQAPIPLAPNPPPYRGYIFSDPGYRDESLKIRTVVPYPEEEDPCLTLEQEIPNG
jgi:hypothetical protein